MEPLHSSFSDRPMVETRARYASADLQAAIRADAQKACIETDVEERLHSCLQARVDQHASEPTRPTEADAELDAHVSVMLATSRRRRALASLREQVELSRPLEPPVRHLRGRGRYVQALLGSSRALD